MSNEVPEPPRLVPTPAKPSPASDGRGWPIQFSWIRKPPLWFSGPLSALAFLVVLVLLGASLIAIARIGLSIVTGSASEVADASKALLPVAAAAVGLPLIIWRLVILAQQTRIAEEKGQIDRETQFTTIFSKSVEQLGSTRELKETNILDGKTETISKTVPNIEMRLGGIHSLLRLANESLKDSPKIEKMLASYVRENSWYDRSGNLITKFSIDKVIGLAEWAHQLTLSPASASQSTEYSEWVGLKKAEMTAARSWVKSLPETRADIFESVAGFTSFPKSTRDRSPALYRESLFVELDFTPEILKRFNFSNCVFVRCGITGPLETETIFSDCTFFECRFTGDELKLGILSSQIVGGLLYESHGSTLSFSSSYISHLVMYNSDNISIRLEYSNTYGLQLRNLKDVLLEMEDTVSVNLQMSTCSAHQGSKFEGSAFVAAAFGNADLTQVKVDNMETLHNSTGSRAALAPRNIRPPRWASALD